jgi:trimeric autotransporter adhesin
VKTIPAILATTVAMVLLFSPLMASAAGSVSFSSPTSGASYSGTATLTIAGTVSPAPGQADSVFLTVSNPSGSTVWADIATVNPTSGAFTDTTTLGGSAYSAQGTYKLSATDSFSAAGSTTFTYTAPGVVAPYNTTRALVDIEGNLTQIKGDLAKLQVDNKGNFTAINTALSTMSTQLTGVTNSLATLTTNVGTLQTDVTNMQGQLTTITSNIATLQTAITAATNAATAAENAANSANSAVSSTQTYVLVVAVLAAITLVLELAILVRKLS